MPVLFPLVSAVSSRARRAFITSAAAVAFALAFFVAEPPAQAQLHWDASAQIGVEKRFMTSAFEQPGFGPAAILSGHVALIPLVRLGAYAKHDISPASEAPARRITTLGVRAKVQAPWSTAKVHAWGFLGAGYALVYAPSTSRTVSTTPLGPTDPASGPLTLSVPGASGHFFEVPLGVGIGVRLRKPWELLFELGGRFGFGFGGDVYEGRPARSPATGAQTLAPVGNDSFSIGLSAGIGLDL